MEDESISTELGFTSKKAGWSYLLEDIEHFSAGIADIELYPYQLEVAHAIIDSVVNNLGLTFCVMFSRQAGKNEVSAHLEAYLMALLMHEGGSIVKAAPTYKPQIINSRLRLERILTHPSLVKYFRPRAGYIFELGKVQLFFFSAGKFSQIVGATAKTLLEIDEAQDVDPDKFEKDLAPMGSTTNVTTVFYGTAWTRDTLLEQKLAHNRILEKQDGIRRNFEYNCEVVGRSNKNYANYVARQVAEKGRDHPIIKTQYYLERLDAQGRLFNAQRQAMFRGEFEREFTPPVDERGYRIKEKDVVYVAVIDHAGQDEDLVGTSGKSTSLDRLPKRDSTICGIARFDLRKRSKFDLFPYASIIDVKQLPTGAKMLDQQLELLAYLNHWQPQCVVTDAIGVGEGPSAFLQNNYKGCFPDFFVKYHASSQSKSAAGYDMIAMIDTGHLKMFRDDSSAEYKEMFKQIDLCEQLFHHGGLMNFFVDDKKGHDDYISLLHFFSVAGRKYRDFYLNQGDIQYTENMMELEPDATQVRQVLSNQVGVIRRRPELAESFFSKPNYEDVQFYKD